MQSVMAIGEREKEKKVCMEHYYMCFVRVQLTSMKKGLVSVFFGTPSSMVDPVPSKCGLTLHAF